MPMPNPNEDERDFVSRYMKDEEAMRHFPRNKQRLAVAYSTYRQFIEEQEKKQQTNSHSQERHNPP